MVEIVRPPVEAGTIESNLTIEWNNWPTHKQRWEATSIHKWNFDVSAYARATGLDIGGDYPHVHQEGGHTLAIVTEMHWPDVGDEEFAPLTIKETWYTNRERNNVAKHMTADIDLDDDGHVERVYANGDTDLLAHIDEGQWVGNHSRHFARLYHTRSHTSSDPVRTVEGDMRKLIKLDCPDDARRADGYVHTPSTTASGD